MPPALPRWMLLALLLATGLGAGCDRDRELHGKWLFDRAYTEAQMAKMPEAKAESKDFLGGMKAGLAKMLVPTLLEKLDGATLTITKKEVIITTKDGTGQAEVYEVVERPDARTWRVKVKDGKIETYTREGDWLVSPATGDVHLIAYFKRAGRS